MSGMQKRLAMLSMLNEQAGQGLNMAALGQRLQNEMSAAPYEQETARLQPQLMQAQLDKLVNGSPFDKQQADAGLIEAIGRMGYGFGADPQMGSDVMTQLLSRYGLYEQDPAQAAARKAAQFGMTPEQLQQIQQRLNGGSNNGSSSIGQ